MRKISYIVVHCTATSPNTTVFSIRRYWSDVLKWKNPGYHFLINASGGIMNLHPEALPANGVKGYNAESIHISYIGGVDKNGKPADTRTPMQKEALLLKLSALKVKYPEAQILGHRDFPLVKKACPCFNVREWLRLSGYIGLLY